MHESLQHPVIVIHDFPAADASVVLDEAELVHESDYFASYDDGARRLWLTLARDLDSGTHTLDVGAGGPGTSGVGGTGGTAGQTGGTSGAAGESTSAGGSLPDTSGTDAGASDDSATTSTSTSGTGGDSSSGDGGCGCRQSPSPSHHAALLGAFALLACARRRRTRAA